MCYTRCVILLLSTGSLCEDRENTSEALMRWKSEKFGDISPIEFILF